MQNNAIWIIDPDKDDHNMIWEIKEELKLPNEFVFLSSAKEALEELMKAPVAPFIIICELNLHGMTGFELREKMLSSHSKKLKSVPFIFWSTHASENQITHAYDLSVHGFFIKDDKFEDQKTTFTDIINYWMKSEMPSKTESR